MNAEPSTDLVNQLHCCQRQNHQRSVFQILMCGCLVCDQCVQSYSLSLGPQFPCPRCRQHTFVNDDNLLNLSPVYRTGTLLQRHGFPLYTATSPSMDLNKQWAYFSDMRALPEDISDGFRVLSLSAVDLEVAGRDICRNFVPHAVLRTDPGIFSLHVKPKGCRWEWQNILTGDWDKDCAFSDLTVSADGCIIATDVANCKVKKYSPYGQLFGFARLSNYPARIDNFSKVEVVISLQKCCKLIILRHVESMRVERVVTTSKCYTAIACLRDLDQLICSTMDWRPCLDIIDCKGNVLRTFTNENLSCGLHWPDYLTLTNMWNVLVSDMGNGQLISLDITSGDIKFVYKKNDHGNSGHSSLTGVTVDKFGRIYLADRLNREIIRLTADGQLEATILTEIDGILRPHGITICDSGHLIIAEYSVHSAIRLYTLY